MFQMLFVIYLHKALPFIPTKLDQEITSYFETMLVIDLWLFMVPQCGVLYQLLFRILFLLSYLLNSANFICNSLYSCICIPINVAGMMYS